MRYTLDTQLSERETYLIGSIVAQWGFIESEIFEQTILSFEDDEPLPKSIETNAQFGEVLKLWLKRVAMNKDVARKAVLTEQHQKILSLNEFRQAIVHSRWEWHPASPGVITANRIHKKKIISVKFTIEDLHDFTSSLGEIRYSLRYPGGLEDRDEEMAKVGGHISRRGWELFSGQNTLEDVPTTNDEDST